MTDAEIRAAHPDWTDEQVAAEAAKQSTTPPAAAPPAPGTGEQDAAFARLRREREAAEARAKTAEDALAEQARKKAEEDGQFKDLAEKEKARADALEADKASERNRRNAERIASSLKFKDAGYALYLLDADQVDLADAAAVKAALEQIAQTRGELVGGATPPPPSGGPAGGSKSDPPGLTRDQLAAMTPKQIAALDPKIVNEALAG